MQNKRKTNYFVSAIEFKEINKNLFIAGLLSLFLGIFGVHRFYLKRKLTGLIFCIMSIISLQFGNGNIVGVLLLLSFAEGVVYIIRGIIWLKEKHTNNNICNNKYTDRLEKTIDGEKSNMVISETIIQTSEKEKENQIEIIEVSDIKPTKILIKNEINHTYQNNWIKKLELPYERNIMTVEQVKDETTRFYEKLCNYLDEELRKSRTSFNKEIKRILASGGHYNNILYTIYCISEGHVTKAYSGSYDYYDPEYSYGILEGHLGKNIRDKVFAKAQEFEKDIASPKSETLVRFNLTEGGLPRSWWDNDGKLRENRIFSTKELNILTATPPRTTIVWDIQGAKSQIINLYLELWELISNGLEMDLKWGKKKKDSLKKIIDGKYIYYADYENGSILASLLKISENTMREIIPNTQILNVVNEEDNIKKYLPRKIVNDINNKIVEYKKDIDIEQIGKILDEMIKKNPSDWKQKVEKILMTDTDRCIDDLISYKNDENFLKIVKEIIKKTDNEDLLLLSLYGIARREKLSQKNTKLLEDILHPNNLPIYKNLIEGEKILSKELFNKLVELKAPIRKRIELDMDKVEVSKKELNETVNIIKEYIGESEEKVIEEKEEKLLEVRVEGSHDKSDLKYSEFLNQILDLGVMDIEDGKKIAMDNGTLLNAFISEVNRELYEYVQDQTIIIENDLIKIDDFYVDMIKELMTNEA